MYKTKCFKYLSIFVQFTHEDGRWATNLKSGQILEISEQSS